MVLFLPDNLFLRQQAMRQIFEQFFKTPVRVWSMLFVLWVAISLVGIGISTIRHCQELERDFQVQSQALYETIRQRLDQNEAVLSGIEALFRTFPNLQFDGVRGYARAMLSRYPHIYTVGLQPHVELKDVPVFEAEASRTIRPGYRIRDFGLEGERTWRPADTRPVYYPVTFMEPPIPDASPVLGLDVYSDPKLRAAIDASLASGKFEASAPFPLVEGGRGYVFFKALSATDGNHAENLVSLLISASKLVKSEEFPRKDIAVVLYRSGFSEDDPSGQLLDRPAQHLPSAWVETTFPGFSFEKAFTTNQQPFILAARLSPGWSIFDWTEVGIVIVATSAVCGLLLVIYLMRQYRLVQEREAANRLQQERARAQVTLAAISDAVIRVDAEGYIEYANQSAEQALQREVSDLVGKNVREAVPLAVALAKESQGHPVIHGLKFRKGSDLPDNTTLIGSDGEETLIEGSVSLLTDDSENISGAVLTFRDMGPIRQRAFAALEASEKRLREHQTELAHVARLNTMGEMASGIAHELNQPLNAILNYNQACLRMLADEEPDFEEIGRAMSQAAAQSKRAGEIIRALRAFISKHDAEPVPLRLEQVTRNALVLAENELHDHQVSVTQNFPADLPEVTADSIQIEQVILNLLRNSIDAMLSCSPEMRRIEVSGRVAGNDAVVTVRDHGPGIAQDMLDRIFHPFHTSKSHGMGLGLTISHSIIESYGGQFRAANHPNGGAELEFSLPITQALT